MSTFSTLIIGATSEIGSALSLHLSQRDHRLFLTGRNSKKLDELLESCSGSEHNTRQVDYLNTADLDKNLFSNQLFDSIVIITPRPSADTTSAPDAEIWRNLFETIFIGPMQLVKQALPCLKEKGKMVILSGITSKQYYPALPQFAVLRSMWLAEAKALSYELGNKQISVNTLSLGGIWTDRLRKKMEQESQTTGQPISEIEKKRTENVPLKKYASLSEVCHAIEQLLSPFTSHISGQNICLDGGFTSTY